MPEEGADVASLVFVRRNQGSSNEVGAGVIDFGSEFTKALSDRSVREFCCEALDLRCDSLRCMRRGCKQCLLQPMRCGECVAELLGPQSNRFGNFFVHT